MIPESSMNHPALGLADLKECSMGGSGDQPQESVLNDSVSPMVGSQLFLLSILADMLATDHMLSLQPDIFDEAMSTIKENSLYNNLQSYLIPGNP